MVSEGSVELSEVPETIGVAANRQFEEEEHLQEDDVMPDED